MHRYILWEAEDHGLQLPYACRMGCCTACAVRVKSGTMYQPEAVGISMELKEQGYGLMCVGYPLTGRKWQSCRPAVPCVLHGEPSFVGLQDTFDGALRERAVFPNRFFLTKKV